MSVLRIAAVEARIIAGAALKRNVRPSRFGLGAADMSVPPEPRIYHITHVDNLRAIVANGELVSDATMMARGGPAASIGMSSIKQRRLSLPVTCHSGDHVGDYVPFYFCPRSIMLYVIHRANHPELQYRGGQRPIIHLEADLHAVVDWATTNRRRWAFSLSNAGASYTDFRDQPSDLVQLDWRAIASTDFRSPSVKEGKQAEFLLHGTFPWGLVSRIGICAAGVASVVSAHLAGTSHRPPIEVRQDWYF